jgi:hypothetical protein
MVLFAFGLFQANRGALKVVMWWLEAAYPMKKRGWLLIFAVIDG